VTQVIVATPRKAYDEIVSRKESVMKKYTTILVILFVLLAVVGGFVFVVSRDDTTTSKTPSVQTSTTKQTYPVRVYFSRHPYSDDDPAATYPVARTAPDLGVGKYAVSELLKGPTANESLEGYFSTAQLREGTSVCGGADFSLKINSGVATLQFCKPFDHLGVVADGQAKSELTDTLKQFSTVQKVIILNSQGDCEFDLSGLNLCKQ
jgi:spore germination protein GerM